MNKRVPKNINNEMWRCVELRLSINLKKNSLFVSQGGVLVFSFCYSYSGALASAKRAWDRAPYSWNMVNLFSFGCHVIDRAYVRTYASPDCAGGVGETIKRKEGVSQACLGKSTSLI